MINKKNIAILGSTGSIGTQALDVISRSEGSLCVTALSCNNNIDLMGKQIEIFHPNAVAVTDEEGAKKIATQYPNLKVYSGEDASQRLATEQDYDVLLNSLVGIAGLLPTNAAIDKKPEYIALANKETMVAGGRYITEKAKQKGVPIIPVDSEHSAIFQCLQSGKDGFDHIILTASGGPFRGKTREELSEVTVEQALKHPNWDMGAKVTIDSASLMNKGLEIIEAKWLFGIMSDEIKVIVHPQSIIHSMVCYKDGAVLAQLGRPEMKVPIAYAFTFPNRIQTGVEVPNLSEIGGLTFEEADVDTFKCLKLAFDALKRSEKNDTDSDTIILNGAAEELTNSFINRKINFLEIGDILEQVMEAHSPVKVKDIDDILKLDLDARVAVNTIIDKKARI